MLDFYTEFCRRPAESYCVRGEREARGGAAAHSKSGCVCVWDLTETVRLCGSLPAESPRPYNRLRKLEQPKEKLLVGVQVCVSAFRTIRKDSRGACWAPFHDGGFDGCHGGRRLRGGGGR